jgi:ABC-type multidrug transport system ATPase subunit/pSer/pThr/pTyr-binding forkhead associated (FHA) protein
MTDDFDISLGRGPEPNVVLKGAKDPDAAEVTLRASALLHGGRRIAIRRAGITIGRDEHCDLVLTSGLVSPTHARIEERGGGQVLIDLGSRTGTYLNGERFRNASRKLDGGDIIAIGGEILHFVTSRDSPLPPIEILAPASSLRMDKPRLTLGRDSGNDVVLDHPNVSPAHAEIVVGQNGARLKDLSQGGTGCRVNGRLVSRTFLKTGDEIGIGPFRLVFDGEMLQQRSQRAGLRLRAENVDFRVSEKLTILQPCSLTVKPGELVAIIGESGAGKSTLIKVLCGVHRASGGRVLVDGEPVATRMTDIGYVPQDEIVHRLLTVREALGYAAELRLPQDTPKADQDAAVARVMEEVGLTEHADTRIGALSGGQRKRAGVASELISQPGMLFLDEPTTGLDPGLEARMMRLFRSLADGGRPVVLVTHATRNLRICDKVVVMGRGGLLCFDGKPDEALEFFGAAEPDDIYLALEEQGAQAWHQRFAARSGEQTEVQDPPPRARAAPARPIAPQAATLTRRYARLVRRDARNLKVLALQVPLLGLAMVMLFKHDVFDMAAEHVRVGQSAQVLFLLVTIAIWFGATAGAREIIKERTVLARELSVGLRLEAYIASKAAVLFALTAAQTIALTIIVVTFVPLHEAGAAFVIAVLLVITTWVAVGMGLLVSAYSHSEDQAGSFVPLILVPQLLFGGAIVGAKDLHGAIGWVSKLAVSQWAFAGAGTAVGLNGRMGRDEVLSKPVANRFGTDFFDLSSGVTILVLAVFLAALAAALHRRLPYFARTT